MFGLGKKKTNEIEEVKEAVAPKPVPMQRSFAMDEVDRVDIPSVSEPKQFAPLFIKIEKYKEVLQKVQKVKTLIKNINTLSSVKNEISKLDRDVDMMIQKNTEEFSQLIEQIDKDFLRPQHFEPFIKDTNAGNAEGYAKDMESEIEKMKQHLKNI